MEKLKHKEYSLPTFQEGDAIRNLEENYTARFKSYIAFCNSNVVKRCECKTNGVVILTSGGSVHCIYRGKSVFHRGEVGELLWRKDD